MLISGDDRDRTGDLLVANQTLSRLSYIPNRDLAQPLNHQIYLLNSTRPGWFPNGTWWSRTTDLILIRDAL